MRRISLVGGGVLVSAMVATLMLAGVEAARPEPGPIVALLSPEEDASLNAASLDVRALVAAVKAAPRRTFVFDGQAVDGRNAGRITRVEVAFDDVPVQQIDTRALGRQLLAHFRLDLSTVADGTHVVTVTAFQGHGKSAASRTVSRRFTLDRSLVPATVNRIEQAATPEPFAALTVRGWDGIEDDDDDLEHDVPAPTRFDLKGWIVPGGQSNGFNLAHDRVVVSLGAQTDVIEPEAWHCDRRGTCRFEDPSRPLVQFASLKPSRHGKVQIRLRGRQLPAERRLIVRIGDDWGGVDLTTGELLVALRPALDTPFQRDGVVGAAGGTIETMDAAGVVIRLDVPAGALTRDTLITVTPLRSSPLVADIGSPMPGVQLEPDGLHFAVPVTLTLDFSAIGPVSPETRFFLVTSPATTLPLPATLDPARVLLTATLEHFSVPAPGQQSPLADRVAWANAVLRAPEPPTSAEISSLIAVLRDQQATGCTTDCINAAAVIAKVDQYVDAAAASLCGDPAANATNAAVERLKTLEALSQQVGGSVPGIMACAHAIIAVQIQRVLPQPASAAATDPILTTLKNAADAARVFGFQDLRDQAEGKLAQGLRFVTDRALATALAAPAGSPAEGVARQQAREVIQQGQVWVTTIVPGVARVDPSLPAYLVDALERLNGSGPFEAVVLANTTRNSASRVSLFSYCSWTGAESAAANDTPFPATFSVEDGRGSSVQATAARPNPNELTFDATVAAVPGCQGSNSAEAGVQIWTRLTFNRSGTLRIDVRPQWVTARCIKCGSQPFVGAEVWDLGSFDDARGRIAYLFYFKMPPRFFTQTPGVQRDGGPLILSVSAGETLYLFVDGFVYGAGTESGRASGRMATMTFTQGDGLPPTMNPMSVSTNEDTAVPITLQATSPTNSPIQFQVLSPLANGFLSGDTPNLVYTPAPNFSGTDTFTVAATDGDLSAPVTISVEVTSENDAPIALGSSVFTGVGQSTAIVLTGSDAEGSSLVFSLVDLPMNGSLTGSLPNLTYVPRSDFVGIDTFTFRTYDGTRYSEPGTIRVFVGIGESQ